MAYPSVAMNDVLAAVSGSDDELARELRSALLSGATRYLDMLKEAEDESQWQSAARRLSGLAASFCAARLQAAADEALARPPGDAGVLRKITRAITSLQL